MRRSGLHALLAGSLTIAALTTTTTTNIHAQPQDEPPTLLPNGGFERGREGWRTFPPDNLAVVDHPTHSGDSSGRVTANGPGNITLMTEYWRVPTEARAEHTLRLWIYADTDVLDVGASLTFFNADFGPVGVEVTVPLATLAPRWQRIEIGPATAPSGAAHGRVSVTAEAAGAGATFYVDSAKLTASAPPVATPSPTPEAEPSFFASLTNGNFELPETTPYGWRAHAGDASIVPAFEGRPRVAALTSRAGVTAWLQQSVAVGGGRWYEGCGVAAARRQRGPRPDQRRLVRLRGRERRPSLQRRLRCAPRCRRLLRDRLDRTDPRTPTTPAARGSGSCCAPQARAERSCMPTTYPSPAPLPLRPRQP